MFYVTRDIAIVNHVGKGGMMKRPIISCGIHHFISWFYATHFHCPILACWVSSAIFYSLAFTDLRGYDLFCNLIFPLRRSDHMSLLDGSNQTKHSVCPNWEFRDPILKLLFRTQNLKNDLKPGADAWAMTLHCPEILRHLFGPAYLATGFNVKWTKGRTVSM